MKKSGNSEKANGAGKRNLFGTDGVRGVANESPMLPETALQLGRAVTFVAGRGGRQQPAARSPERGEDGRVPQGQDPLAIHQ